MKMRKTKSLKSVINMIIKKAFLQLLDSVKSDYFGPGPKFNQ